MTDAEQQSKAPSEAQPSMDTVATAPVEPIQEPVAADAAAAAPVQTAPAEAGAVAAQDASAAAAAKQQAPQPGAKVTDKTEEHAAHKPKEVFTEAFAGLKRRVTAGFVKQTSEPGDNKATKEDTAPEAGTEATPAAPTEGSAAGAADATTTGSSRPKLGAKRNSIFEDIRKKLFHSGEDKDAKPKTAEDKDAKPKTAEETAPAVAATEASKAPDAAPSSSTPEASGAADVEAKASEAPTSTGAAPPNTSTTKPEEPAKRKDFVSGITAGIRKALQPVSKPEPEAKAGEAKSSIPTEEATPQPAASSDAPATEAAPALEGASTDKGKPEAQVATPSSPPKFTERLAGLARRTTHKQDASSDAPAQLKAEPTTAAGGESKETTAATAESEAAPPSSPIGDGKRRTSLGGGIFGNIRKRLSIHEASEGDVPAHSKESSTEQKEGETAAAAAAKAPAVDRPDLRRRESKSANIKQKLGDLLGGKKHPVGQSQDVTDSSAPQQTKAAEKEEQGEAKPKEAGEAVEAKAASGDAAPEAPASTPAPEPVAPVVEAAKPVEHATTAAAPAAAAAA